MSELTSIQILNLLNNLPAGEGLNLSGKNLEGVDLSSDKAAELAQNYGDNLPRGLSKYEDGTCFFELSIFDGGELRSVNLQEAQLMNSNFEGAFLEGANLQEADLTDANFHKAWLSDANFRGGWLWGVNFQEADLVEVNLQETRLMNADFAGADLKRANLQGATLYGANFQGAKLFEADLRTVRLYDETLFMDAETARAISSALEEKKPWSDALGMTAAASVSGVDFRGADIRRARLDGVDMYGAELEAAYFYGISLDGTKLRAEQLKPRIGEDGDKMWDMAKEAYLSLKNLFKTLGRYDDARWAYVKEKIMERKLYFPSEEGDEEIDERLASFTTSNWRKKLGLVYKFWLYIKLFFRPRENPVHRWLWLRNLTWEITCNYGDSIALPVFWAIVIIFVLCPPLFYYFGGVITEGLPASYADCVIFSMRSFATISFTDFTPLTYFGKVWSSLEAMAGVATFALIIYTFGRRLAVV